MMAQSLQSPTGQDADEKAQRRRARSRAIMIALLAMVALIYAVSIVRMGGG